MCSRCFLSPSFGSASAIPAGDLEWGGQQASFSSCGVVWAVTSSLTTYPPQASRISTNLRVPKGVNFPHGPTAALDWGQNLLDLKYWLDNTLKVRPIPARLLRPLRSQACRKSSSYDLHGSRRYGLPPHGQRVSKLFDVVSTSVRKSVFSHASEHLSSNAVIDADGA